VQRFSFQEEVQEGFVRYSITVVFCLIITNLFIYYFIHPHGAEGFCAFCVLIFVGADCIRPYCVPVPRRLPFDEMLRCKT